MSNNRRENRRYRRVRLESPIRVVMGSIGANVRYDMETSDVSTNGFFLDFDSPGRFPFNHSSIMEVWMEAGNQKTIFFNGKMARIVHPNEAKDADTGPGIAIKIVQIDGKNEELLRKLLEFHGASEVPQADDNISA